MKTVRLSIRSAMFLVWLALAGATAARAPVTPPPTDSIYRLDLALVDQDARASRLSDRQGGPLLIAMFYSSCKYTCPLTIDAIRRVEHALDNAERKRLRVLLVSFDPVRDTPQALRAVVDERHVERARWTLARTDAAGVRKLAAVLGVQYRALADGNFSHSSAITLIDAQGRIAARTERVDGADQDFLAATRKVLAPAH